MKIIELDFLDSKTAKFIEELNAKGGPPIYKLPVNDARNVLKSLQADSVEKSPLSLKTK